MKRKFPAAVILALLAVGLFNLVSVWGPQALIHDDAAKYLFVEQGRFPLRLVRWGSALHAANEWLAWNVMARSKELARLLYVLLWMVPLAWLLNRLFVRRLAMPVEAALAACAVPLLLPAQWVIPASINLSYVLPGLLAMTACLHCAAGFARGTASFRRQAIAAALLYLAATQLMDHSLFFFPLLLFLLYFPGASRRGRPLLTAALAGVFLFKAAWVILAPRPAAVPAAMAKSRLANAAVALGDMLPLPLALRRGWAALAAVAALIACGAWLAGVFSRASASAQGGRPGSGRPGPRLAWGMMALWFAGNLLPFLLLARKSSPRHTFIAAIGLAALLAMALQAIVCRLWPGRTRWFAAAALAIVALAGAWRWSEAGAVYRGLNARQAMIRSRLQEARLPAGSQVAVYLAGQARIYWGDWVQSTGHLHFMLRRRDVGGCIGPRSRYAVRFDPFRTQERRSRRFFRGFSLQRPLFLFVEHQGRLRQFAHFLRWGGWDGPESWSLHCADRRTGKITEKRRGRGTRSLDLALRELGKNGIDPRGVVWHAPLPALVASSPPG